MISIVIRTRNSANTLFQVLKKLSPQVGDELIIVDSGSTDETLAIASQFGAKILFHQGQFNYGHALNLGFAQATNEWVLSLSSHCIPISPAFLEEYRKVLTAFSSVIVAAYGPALIAASRDSGQMRLPAILSRASSSCCAALFFASSSSPCNCSVVAFCFSSCCCKLFNCSCDSCLTLSIF